MLFHLKSRSVIYELSYINIAYQLEFSRNLPLKPGFPAVYPGLGYILNKYPDVPSWKIPFLSFAHPVFCGYPPFDYTTTAVAFLLLPQFRPAPRVPCSIRGQYCQRRLHHPVYSGDSLHFITLSDWSKNQHGRAKDINISSLVFCAYLQPRDSQP